MHVFKLIKIVWSLYFIIPISLFYPLQKIKVLIWNATYQYFQIFSINMVQGLISQKSEMTK